VVRDREARKRIVEQVVAPRKENRYLFIKVTNDP